MDFSSRHLCVALQTRLLVNVHPTGASDAYTKTRTQALYFVSHRANQYSNTALGRDRIAALHAETRIEGSSPPVSSFDVKTQANIGSWVQKSGIFLAFGVVIALAISKEGSPNVALQAAELDSFDSVARGAVTNVMSATVPTGSTDLIAAALGESIGGILGATCGVLVSMIGGKKGMKKNPLVAEAIADSDFFIANSASTPLLEAFGLPPALASVIGVVVASVPSQLVKAASRENERRLEEKTLMEQLLEEKRLEEEARNPFFKTFNRFFTSEQTSQPQNISPKDMEPAERSIIDLVEVFSDCTRWLAYDVLKTDFGATLMWNGLMLDSSLTGAFFGLLAAISSQVYADVLYAVFRYGPEERQKQVFARSNIDWLSVYASRAVSTAALFGVYEFSQGPISRYIQGTLAGGVDGCVGSKSFDLCLQTYIDTNAPGPSTEAQFRALVVNLSIVYQRLQDIAVDTSLDDFKALFHTWLVTAQG